MKLLFRKTCSCPITPDSLPKPSFTLTSDLDTDADPVEIFADVSFICPGCNTPYESFAGLLHAPKKPSIIRPV